MQYILGILFLLLAGGSYAQEVVEDVTEEVAEEVKEEAAEPTYMECFKHVYAQDVEQEQSDIQAEMARLNSGGSLPVDVEREKVDVHSLNPRINPNADDVKASLEIDLPQKKEEAEGLSKQCETLYQLK